MQRFDMCVIGNGVLGLSTAYALSVEDPSLKIGIIGAFTRIGGASLAAGAMLGCFGEVTEVGLASEFGRAKLDMAVKSSHMWPSWLSQINESIGTIAPLSTNPGTFVILNSNSGKLDDVNYNAILKALELYGEPYEKVDPRDIPGIDPIETNRPLRALYIPREGFINPSMLVDSFHNIFKKSPNITLIDDSVVTLDSTDDKINSVETKNGKVIGANQFLLAAGAYSQILLDQLPQLKFKIPRILSGWGCSLILEYGDHPFRHVIRSPNRAGACGAHIMPYDRNTLYTGASNSLRFSCKTNPRAKDVYYLLDQAIGQFNQHLHKSEMLKWQVGNRPVTVDTFPLIGKTPITNLWLLTGTYRDGIHDSPWLAETISKQMLGTSTAINCQFSPVRKPISTMDKDSAIKEFVEHLTSAAYEHSIKLPKMGWESVLEKMWQYRAESLYSQLKTDIGLPPDLLILLDQEPESIPFFCDYYEQLEKNNKNSTSLSSGEKTSGFKTKVMQTVT